MCTPLMLLQLLFIVLLWPEVAGSTLPLAKPNCYDRCGDVLVPYPFGFGSKECYKSSEFGFFNLICNNSYNPPKLFIWGSEEVVNISYQGQVSILSNINYECYNRSGHLTHWQKVSWLTHNIVKLFTMSDSENRFTTLGCDTVSKLTGFNGQFFQSGCNMICKDASYIVNGSCMGLGCCQTSIPKGFGNFDIFVASYENHTKVYDFSRCSYAFIIQTNWFNFSVSDLLNFTSINGAVPVVYDWAVDLKSCEDAMKNQTTYACKNSECVTSKNGFGYSCVCPKGYEGNPYLHDGCQDVNECKLPNNNCYKNAECKNTPGSYDCYCPKGFYGDGLENGTHCVPSLPVIKIVAGTGASCLFLFVLIWFIYWAITRRQKVRENFFQKNGGMLLQQQIASHKGVKDIAKIFPIKVLKKATNNFHENGILGQGGFGTVYKGVLSSGKVVAIKRSKIMDKGQIIQFINEVSILSQINHRHVVKLLGCCLETEVPILVYEFVSNGTLFQHIHRENQAHSLSWEHRLRIAAEAADALAYLHSSHSIPIFHRDVKSSNILLDDKYKAKVSDFGTSRLVPLDQTEKTTIIQGTFGYLDPECFPTGQLTDKSDVYSFGVVLAELLTGKKPILLDASGERTSLAAYFVSSMKDGNLFGILDDPIATEENKEHLLVVAKLARSCLEDKREDRPTMKEVASELDYLKAFYELPSIQQNQEDDDQEDDGKPFPSELGGPSTYSTDAALEIEVGGRQSSDLRAFKF